MKVIKTIEELKNFIEEFDDYCFNPYNATIFFSYSYSHYANQECNVEGEALAFLEAEELEEELLRIEEEEAEAEDGR